MIEDLTNFNCYLQGEMVEVFVNDQNRITLGKRCFYVVEYEWQTFMLFITSLI